MVANSNPESYSRHSDRLSRNKWGNGNERSKKANHRLAQHIAHSSELCGHSHNRTLDLESGTRLLEHCLAARLFDKNLHHFFAAHDIHFEFAQGVDELV